MPGTWDTVILAMLSTFLLPTVSSKNCLGMNGFYIVELMITKQRVTFFIDLNNTNCLMWTNCILLQDHCKHVASNLLPFPQISLWCKCSKTFHIWKRSQGCCSKVVRSCEPKMKTEPCLDKKIFILYSSSTWLIWNIYLCGLLKGKKMRSFLLSFIIDGAENFFFQKLPFLVIYQQGGALVKKIPIFTW